jgi:hypothetical protein
MLNAVRAVVATALAGVLVWSATGCGTDTVGGEQLARAADTSGRTTGFKVGLEGTVGSQQGDIDMTGSGVMDMKGQRGELTFDVAGQEIRQVMDRFVMYMQAPSFEGVLEDGEKWAKIDLGRASREFGVDLGAVQNPGSGDPRQMFAQLKAMSGDIEEVGTEEVRGVETTHYSGDVEIDNLHKALPPDRQAAARKSIERAKEVGGLKDYPLDVWIDDDDQVRRMRIRMEMEPRQQKVTFDFTMDFFDYGTRVDIDIPPEDEVRDVTQLTAQTSAAAGAGAP